MPLALIASRRLHSYINTCLYSRQLIFNWCSVNLFPVEPLETWFVMFLALHPPGKLFFQLPNMPHICCIRFLAKLLHQILFLKDIFEAINSMRLYHNKSKKYKYMVDQVRLELIHFFRSVLNMRKIYNCNRLCYFTLLFFRIKFF